MKFLTEKGIIVPAVSATQMIEIDRIAISVTGPNLFQMMENAGRNLSLLTLDKLGSKWKDSKVLVLAGTGGNGGGGICAARHLANHGVKVSVCLTDPDKLKDVPAFQLHVLKSTQANIISITDIQNENPDVIIDAIIGYSLLGEPQGNALKMIKWAKETNSLTISLDVPSGINSTSGNKSANFIQADATLTLALPKTGLFPQESGELYLGDIGIPEKVFKQMDIDYMFPFEKSFYVRIHKIL
jgi:NAD(P)H-hydrate epimerase